MTMASNLSLIILSANETLPAATVSSRFKTQLKNQIADRHFEEKRHRADNPTEEERSHFFKMTKRVGAELNRRTKCMDIRGQRAEQGVVVLAFPSILDLCMAPGGFSATALKENPHCVLRTITFDPNQGGHDVSLLERNEKEADVQIEFMDVTMLAGEMGLAMTDIPSQHPEAKKLVYDNIFPDVDEFDLVFCGGVPTRNHRAHQTPYREFVEGRRLAVSQLVVALNHISEGGTMVMLMQRPETWTICQPMYMLSKFSEIRAFKPRSVHRTKSSFYLVATNVKPHSDEAQEVVRCWKDAWKRLTFSILSIQDTTVAELEDTDLADLAGESVEEVLRNFGAQLLSMSATVWLEQAQALKNAPWLREAQSAGDCKAEGSGSHDEHHDG